MENTPLDITPDSKDEDSYLSDKIIISYRDTHYMFQSDSYNEEILGDIISRSDYDKIIKQASRLMERSWIKKRQNDLIKTPNFIILASIVATVLFCFYIVLIIISAYYNNEKIINIISIVCVSISLVIILFLSFYNFLRKEGKSISLDEIIKLDIDNLFDQVNKVYKGELCFEYDTDVRNIICRMVKKNGLNFKEENRNPMTEENLFLRF